MTDSFRDFGADAQQIAEAHLDACYESFYSDEEGDGLVDSPASAPFCGCSTCVTREILWAAWGVIDAYIDDALGMASDDETLS